MSGAHLDADRSAALAAGGEPTDDEALHLLDCAACRRAMAPSRRLDAALGQIAAGTPSVREEAVLARVLVADRARRRRSAWVKVGVPVMALAAAAAMFAGSRSLRPNGVSHATVTASPDASVVRHRTDGDEVVQLTGAATFQVTKLPPGARFRVRAAADELEVKGTSFRVDATAAGFRSVTVESGVVEVRPQCCAAVTLRAGDAWTAPPSDDIATSASSPIPPAPAEPSSVASATPPVPSPGAASAQVSGADLLAQGTSAYDGGRFAVAAAMLARAVAAEPSAPWARDARVLAGSAQVLSSSPASIPNLGVSTASFDAAAQKASVAGDTARAKAAAVGAARHSSGENARRRWCALSVDGALPAAFREEATRGCARR